MSSLASSLVGVIHLPALPGSPRNQLRLRAIAESAVRDAKALQSAGFDLIMLENFGDAPFFPTKVPPVTVAALTVCAEAVRQACPQTPLGINVLRNDGEAALSIATAVDAACIRVNVLTGARVTDQGIIEGDAANLLRLRRSLNAESVAIWADVDVKHSAPLGHRSLGAETKDVVLRALASTVLVTGEGTGVAVDETRLGEVRRAAPDVPVLVASGATLPLLPQLAKLCDGVIVGSALREGGRAGGPILETQAKAFAEGFRKAFGR